MFVNFLCVLCVLRGENMSAFACDSLFYLSELSFGYNLSFGVISIH